MSHFKEGDQTTVLNSNIDIPFRMYRLCLQDRPSNAGIELLILAAL